MKEDTARPKRLLKGAILLASALWLLPAAGLAQGGHPYTVALMGGLGGSTDAEPDTGLDNAGWQLLFAMEIDLSTQFSVRAGQLDLGADDPLAELYESELRYLTVAGEYQMTAGFYESGLYLGLGYYDLDGGVLVGGDSALGLVLGSSGEFRLTDRFRLRLELSGHYADLDHAQFFLMGHFGVAFRF